MSEPGATPNYKRLIRRTLARANLDVRRRPNVPFGVRWEDDIAYFLRDGSLGVAFDVGAHQGETAMMLVQTFPGVAVHSFEPVPSNYSVLANAISGHNVRATQVAVSNESGTLELALGDTDFRGSAHGTGPAIKVPAVTIDEYVAQQQVARVDLLKIDTEGHEPAVLSGASKLLAAGTTEFVLCECEFTARADEPHGNFRAIFDILEPLGYRVVSFYTAGIDNLGWLWGDVLFRHAPGQRDPHWASRSPYV
jgi:FkbM family methyltransferase